MNIFNQAPEFIEWDNRKDREINRVTAESTYNRLLVQLPEWLIKDSTILDLGSCLGAAGHMALTNNATHYTGIEIQETYFNQSQEILAKYWPKEKFTIIKQNLEDFLDHCIANNIQYDFVLASGVLYAFLNIISILEKISKVSRKVVIIDTMFVPNKSKSKRGLISLRPDMPMVYANGQKTFTGLGASLNINALDLLMRTNSFHRTEDVIVPPITVDSHDGYTDLIVSEEDTINPVRYMVRYYRTNSALVPLITKIVNNDIADVVDFYKVEKLHKTGADLAWKFDPTVASRFQHEALTNIPDYERVIEMCVEVAKTSLSPGRSPEDVSIIDVGSALGYTVDKFIQAGFTNISGVDNSEAMVAQSKHKERIILSDTLPDATFNIIIINWTLHFVIDKLTYLQDVFKKLRPGGFLILSDKTSQLPVVKNMYYDFKRANGVSDEYIKRKEKALAGVMHTMPAEWYMTHLEKLGFQRVEILNARYGFVTYLCKN
jgi:SAM-dependent methyltransferase